MEVAKAAIKKLGPEGVPTRVSPDGGTQIHIPNATHINSVCIHLRHQEAVTANPRFRRLVCENARAVFGTETRSKIKHLQAIDGTGVAELGARNATIIGRGDERETDPVRRYEGAVRHRRLYRSWRCRFITNPADEVDERCAHCPSVWVWI
ncbi:hypothetical protein ALQ92_200172 [Pseudomonas syringae pv. pisi]|nr:hypothetical protein ALQ92_200172 [Pseudomonas syringae pv. pisi]